MKPWLLAVLGLLVVIGAVVADLLLLTEPWVRNGYWTYLAIVPGLGLAVAAVVQKRGWTTILPGVFTLLAAGGYSGLRFMQAPATSPTIAVQQEFPDFALPDQNGRTLTLGELRRDGPVIVVLFRGSW